MSAERRVLRFPGAHRRVAAAAGASGEEGRDTGKAEPTHFQGIPCLVPADFLSGSQPGSSRGVSTAPVVPWGTGAFFRPWLAGRMPEVGPFLAAASLQNRGCDTECLFSASMTAMRVKICIVLIPQLALAVPQRSMICLGEVGAPGRMRCHLLSKDSGIFSVYSLLSWFVTEAPGCSNNSHKTLIKVILVGCGACFLLMVPNMQCSLEVSYQFLHEPVIKTFQMKEKTRVLTKIQKHSVHMKHVNCELQHLSLLKSQVTWVRCFCYTENLSKHA